MKPILVGERRWLRMERLSGIMEKVRRGDVLDTAERTEIATVLHEAYRAEFSLWSNPRGRRVAEGTLLFAQVADHLMKQRGLTAKAAVREIIPDATYYDRVARALTKIRSGDLPMGDYAVAQVARDLPKPKNGNK